MRRKKREKCIHFQTRSTIAIQAPKKSAKVTLIMQTRGESVTSLTDFVSSVVCDNVSVGGWPQLRVCLRGTMFVLWGYADRWLGHLYVCGRTVPPLSASQREWIAEAARHTVVSVNLTSWAPDLPLTSMMPPDLVCHCTRGGEKFIPRPHPIVGQYSEL